MKTILTVLFFHILSLKIFNMLERESVDREIWKSLHVCFNTFVFYRLEPYKILIMHAPFAFSVFMTACHPVYMEKAFLTLLSTVHMYFNMQFACPRRLDCWKIMINFWSFLSSGPLYGVRREGPLIAFRARGLYLAVHGGKVAWLIENDTIC